MMKITNGNLSISVNVQCPECGGIIDLLTVDGLGDDGWIYKLVMPKDKHWSGACNDFSKDHKETFGEDFKCPDCEKTIYIKEIEY